MSLVYRVICLGIYKWNLKIKTRLAAHRSLCDDEKGHYGGPLKRHEFLMTAAPNRPERTFGRFLVHVFGFLFRFLYAASIFTGVFISGVGTGTAPPSPPPRSLILYKHSALMRAQGRLRRHGSLIVFFRVVKTVCESSAIVTRLFR